MMVSLWKASRSRNTASAASRRGKYAMKIIWTLFFLVAAIPIAAAEDDPSICSLHPYRDWNVCDTACPDRPIDDAIACITGCIDSYVMCRDELRKRSISIGGVAAKINDKFWKYHTRRDECWKEVKELSICRDKCESKQREKDPDTCPEDSPLEAVHCFMDQVNECVNDNCFNSLLSSEMRNK